MSREKGTAPSEDDKAKIFKTSKSADAHGCSWVTKKRGIETRSAPKTDKWCL